MTILMPSATNGLRKFKIYRRRHLKFDFVSAVVVFLIAIPLCLGIALASGAPLLSGILSGIVGGILVGGLSGSHVSVAGPAAGMSAVVFSVIVQLGGFNAFLLALFISGVYQVIMGYFKAGFIADYVPANVIQGLLSAVGILIIVKQIPLAITLSHSLSSLKTQLLDLSSGFSLAPLEQLTVQINTGAVILSLGSLLILVYIGNTKRKWIRTLPGPFIVVVLGILVNELFLLFDSSLAQVGPHLVRIPIHNGFGDFLSQMQSPTWSALANPKVYLLAFLLASVSSLENLLNLKAGERLDTKHRYCNKDRELVAQGIGNIIAGLIGGIPITSVIVRTSINIQTGAKTKMATILHGTFILLAMILIPNALNKIPLSSLAGVLIYTGYKLTSPQIYTSIYRQGWDRFIPFLTTVICILYFNLLFGILFGLIISLFFILKSNSQVRLDIIQENYPQGIINRLVLPQQTTFLNKASLVTELDSIPKNSQLIIDARYSDFIDKEIIEFIKEFSTELAPNKHIALNLIGFKEHYEIHNYIDFINVTTYDVQATVTPQQALNLLKEGNTRFKEDTCIHRSFKTDIEHTATTQHPIAVVLGCIDSRVPVETIFDMSFGDLFCARIAGNVVNTDILASMEYACNVVGAKLIVVLGHTGCGAIQAACDNVRKGCITQLLDKIKPAIAAETSTKQDRSGKNRHFIYKVTQLNIANTIHSIYHESQILSTMIDNEEIGIVGAVYDVSSGDVSFQDFSPFIKQLGSPDSEQLTKKLSKTITAANRMLQNTTTDEKK
ncbi:MAG: SulP family inorganic anion transporter [Gammaproteobacteria bacterium]|nr:SulP family inorganic anion transporter [Gammaproteobacteria bacterium]